MKEKKTYIDEYNNRKEYELVDNKLHGITKTFDAFNRLLSEENYFSGSLHGPAKYYSNDILSVREGSYKNGKPVGVWTIADYSNTVLRTKDYGE